MECNKDEALRAKEIAKRKFLANDILGAKKFALKAQNLYPELEDISQMIATLEVHLSAENKVSGELDYYSILGVSQEANYDTVRKRYRNLAIMLHPDKNKSVGAEGAFKYISQAWSLLSDKARKVEYDKRRTAELYEKVKNSGGSSLANPATNGFQNFTKTSSNNTSKVKISKSGTPRSAPSASPTPSHKPKPDSTFWTACHSCRTQYEYLRIYLNHNLLCPNCHEAFLALETAPPGSGSIRRSFSDHAWNSNHRAAGKNRTGSGRSNGVYGNFDSYNQANFQWAAYSSTDNSAYGAQGTRRKNSKRMYGVSSTTNASAKRRRGMENTGASNITSLVGRGTGGQNLGGVNGFATNSSGSKDISDLDIQNRLMKKAIREVQRKLRESNNNAGAETVAKRRRIEAEKDNVDGENSLANKEVCVENEAGESDVKNESNCIINSVLGSSHTNKGSNISEALTIDVLDPDLCNFDKDRTERTFGDDQVWAAYDSFDGMPRCYAMIHSVLSLDPFKVRISWLTSEPNSELRSANWLGSGFALTCGDFRVGKSETFKALDCFSHKVKWTKGKQGEIRIYPRKGDVWALHKSWYPNWNYLTEAETTHEYEIVEVIEGYTEDFGATVVPLVKVAGFTAVFHHHLDPREIRTIPRAELSRFSHQIPSYLFTGQESLNSLKGCRELDPAATPLYFLRVIFHGKKENFGEEKMVEQQDAAFDAEAAKDQVNLF